MGGKFSKSEKLGISNQIPDSGLLHSYLGIFFKKCPDLFLIASKKENQIIELNKGNYTWSRHSKGIGGYDWRRIGVESASGVGSTFGIELPRS
ncbi:MAG: hypothetical protein A2066_20745 [Bacteroidetes bacterium GWB2_41_8]|nr:MAG: hypothetical protein A2066_20745 [Bacteroidetes bacterium GWB2_41_8]